MYSAICDFTVYRSLDCVPWKCKGGLMGKKILKEITILYRGMICAERRHRSGAVGDFCKENSVKVACWPVHHLNSLCSPSVLDRLNALLEPGGVLTVSERGMIDGSTPTITPHPNFR